MSLLGNCGGSPRGGPYGCCCDGGGGGGKATGRPYDGEVMASVTTPFSIAAESFCLKRKSMALFTSPLASSAFVSQTTANQGKEKVHTCRASAACSLEKPKSAICCTESSLIVCDVGMSDVRCPLLNEILIIRNSEVLTMGGVLTMNRQPEPKKKLDGLNNNN